MLLEEAWGSLDSLDYLLATNKLDSIVTRDLSRCAWIALTLPRPPSSQPNVSAAQRYLSILFASQLPDGQFPWLLSEHTLTDPNAVEFVGLPLAAIWARYQDALGPAFVAAFRPNVTATALAVKVHVVNLYYTNIITMKLVNELLLGAALPLPAVLADGRETLASFSALLQGAGLHEYGCPTYGATTLNNLVTGAMLLEPSLPAEAASLGSCAAYAMAAAFAAFHPPSGALSGAHARDYDFMFGRGAIEHYWTLLNVSGAPPPEIGNQSEGIYATIAVAALGWAGPPAAAAANASLGAAYKVVQQTTCATSLADGEPCAAGGNDKYTLLLPDVTLGVASAAYGPQDKLVLGALAPPVAAPPGTTLAQMSLVLDRFDAPWGRVSTPDGNGHEKPTHLASWVSAVQDGGLALVLADLAPQWRGGDGGSSYASAPDKYDNVALNIVFPHNVDALLLDGMRIPGNASFSLPALNSTLGLRSRSGLLAARVLAADGVHNYTPHADVRFDGPPGSGAARLVVYLYRGRNVTVPANASTRVAVLFAAASAEDDVAAAAALAAVGNATAVQSVAGDVWTVDVAPAASLPTPPAGLGSALSASLNYTSHGTGRRLVNGTAYTPRLFRVTNATGTVDIVPPLPPFTLPPRAL